MGDGSPDRCDAAVWGLTELMLDATPQLPITEEVLVNLRRAAAVSLMTKKRGLGRLPLRRR